MRCTMYRKTRTSDSGGGGGGGGVGDSIKKDRSA